MAIIRLDCNLNGGDSVTPNDSLFYRIYGDVDNYTTPIHTTGTALSDANVTVDGDRVIITGVDGASNVTFKIAAVDLAGNEGVLSDAVGTIEYAINFNSANQEYLIFTQKTSSGNRLNKVSVYRDVNLASDAIIGFTASSNPAELTFATADGLTQTGYGTSYNFPPGEWMDIEVSTDGANATFKLNGTTVDTISGSNADREVDCFGRYSSLYFDGKIKSIYFDGEQFNFDEGTGSTTTGSLGTVCTLMSNASVEDMWITV